MAASKSKKMMKSLGGDIPSLSDDAVGHTAVAFPALEDFDNVDGSDEISKWTALPLNRVFRVLAVKEITCRNTIGGADPDRVCRIATLEDAHGVISTVWLPGVVEKRLLEFPREDVDCGRLFLRSLGPKVSKTTGYTYHNFNIIKS